MRAPPCAAASTRLHLPARKGCDAMQCCSPVGLALEAFAAILPKHSGAQIGLVSDSSGNVLARALTRYVSDLPHVTTIMSGFVESNVRSPKHQASCRRLQKLNVLGSGADLRERTFTRHHFALPGTLYIGPRSIETPRLLQTWETWRDNS